MQKKRGDGVGERDDGWKSLRSPGLDYSILSSHLNSCESVVHCWHTLVSSILKMDTLHTHAGEKQLAS